MIIRTNIVSSCSHLERIEDVLPQKGKIEKKVTQTKKVSIACNRGDIKSYIDKGWKIVSQQKDEVPCTWKTEKANRKCNIELDKGCRITVPDKMGEEIIYNLEREVVENEDD